MGDAGGSVVSPPTVTSREHEALLNTIDKIRALGISSHIHIPQIVVCGDQSAGKSSVLEAICGLRFQVGDGLCTVFATEYILRRADQESVYIGITPGSDVVDEEEIARLQSWTPSTTDLNRFNTIMEEAKHAMGVGQGKNFSQHCLRIEVCGPSQTNLSLVDVPGLFHTPGKGQTVIDKDTVTSLVQNYIKNPRSIIMAVVSAKSDPELQITLTFAHEHDPDGNRTIGVITKPDTLSKNSPNEERYFTLAQNKDSSAQFKLGWSVLRNRGFEERDCSPAERDENEHHFFNQGKWAALEPSLKGVDALRVRLAKILHDHIITELPSMLKDVENSIDVCERKLKALGSSRGTPLEQRLYLHRASVKYKSLMNTSSDGIYSDPFFGSSTNDVNFKKRIRAVAVSILQDFGNEMRLKGHAIELVDELPRKYKHKFGMPKKMKEEDYYNDVQLQMRRNAGRELPGLFNPDIVKSLFLEQCKPWGRIVKRTLNSLIAAAQVTTRQILEEVADDGTIDKLMVGIVNPAMQLIERDLRAKTQDLLHPILHGPPITLNNYLTETIQKRRQDETRKDLSARLFSFLGRDPSSENLEARQYKGNFDVRALLDTLVKTTEKDMQRFAAIDAANAMFAYYQVALERILDDFSIYAVEVWLLEKLPGLFDPETIVGLDSESITKIAGESEESNKERKLLNAKLEALKNTQETAYLLDSHKPQDNSLGPDGLDIQQRQQDSPSQEQLSKTMRFTSFLLAALTATTTTVAIPTLKVRDSCVETCGSTCYWQSDIDAAVNKGYSDYQSGTTEGDDSYPHTYNNYEGFDFPVSGPYQEFPILSSYQVYSGGSPGPDRVIFNTDGDYAGTITHTGASGNDFVACQAG
ncbi:hypothetical protein DV736_g1599, partial [Chaetothyriales sp. CBS 134916]